MCVNCCRSDWMFCIGFEWFEMAFVFKCQTRVHLTIPGDIGLLSEIMSSVMCITLSSQLDNGVSYFRGLLYL